MTARRLVIGIFVTTVLVLAVAMALGLAAPASGEPWWFVVGVAAIAIVYVGAGALLAVRLPRNPIGWILIAIGALQACNGITSGYANFRTDGRHLPFADVAGWSGTWTWIPSVGSLVTFLLLLFPDGRPPSPRWRVVAWVSAVGIAAGVVGTMVGYWPVRRLALEDPDAVDPTGAGVPLLAAGFALTGVAAVASAASLVVRYRRARADERQQLRWFTLAGAVVVVGTLLSFTSIDPSYVVLVVGFFLVPIAVAIAILRYRLYELDVVVSKAVVYGVLAAFVTLVYAGLVVGVGAAIGRGGNAVLSAVAAAVVALAFQPVRRRAQRIANRLVYGERATPYEVLSDFSDRMGGAFPIDDLMPRMAQVLARGTGASSARVMLRVGAELRELASWPPGAGAADGEHVTPVSHQGEDLGALAVAMPASDPMDPVKGKLVRDLASQAGLVLRNARLIEELRASRQRIVAVQDEERRRLERDLHDGAQQQLVALTVKARLARSMAERDAAKATDLLEQIEAETQAALEQLRELARGIYPPVLADHGLAAALKAQAARAAVATSVDADGVGRYPREVESAVYFSVLEALNNVAKYAGASRASIRLRATDAELRFEVADDGVGFDPGSTARGTGLQGMADRLDAIGGRLAVRSSPGRGTMVVGRVSVPSGGALP